MVTVHPNPPPGQGFTHFYSYHFGGEPITTPAMKRTENSNFLQTPSYWSATAGVEDPTKKVRKSYTITKSRESWSEQEHDKFLEALHLFDRDWKKVEAFIGSKTVIQIRSHAQKYFMKVQKNGTSEHVPPPRPKRKAAHPYPHKAPKKDDFALAGGTKTYNWSSNSNEIAPCTWASNETNCQVEENLKEKRAVPDFAQVYSFIGSLFDPSTRDHSEKLKKMEPINVETVLMLMKSISVNLVSPEFENHRRLLASYNVDTENDR